jgi:tetratricopeptide (TPR) repeat protein
MPSFVCLLAFSMATFAQTAAVRCAVNVPGAPTDADRALATGEFAKADQLFSAEVASAASPRAYVGLVHAQLANRNITGALASAQKAIAAFPASAETQTALGEALLRNAQIIEASAAFSKALTLDHCYARAHFGAGKVLNLASMRAGSHRDFSVAHQLAPADEEIRLAWIEGLAPSQQAPALKEFLADAKTLNADQRQTLEAQVALDEKGKACHLATPVENVKLDLMPLLYSGTHVRDWGLNAKFNDRKSTLLELDTSVSGIVLGRDFAHKAGFENILRAQPGASESNYISYADSVKIGSLELRDCPIRVVDDGLLANGNSLISADVFKDHIITINFAGRSLTLSPLPKPPAAAAADAPQDRYVAPEMKDWTRVYVADDRILVPTGINQSGPFIFMLDTGTIFTTLSPTVTKTVLDIAPDVTAPIRGVSGKIVKTYFKEGGGDVDHASMFGENGERINISRPYKTAVYHFGPYQLLDNKGYSFDLTPLSQSVGLEISGLLGFPIMKDFGVALDYRDGLMQFIFDKEHVYRTREGSYF